MNAQARPGAGLARRAALASALAPLLAGGALAGDDLFDLNAGFLVKSGASALSVDAHAAPCVADWNGDGRADLLVGQFTSGNIWLFVNQGAAGAPSFGAGSLLRAGGSAITTSWG